MIDDLNYNQFEDAPEDQENQDCANPDINNETYSNDSNDDYEEDYDSDFGENDDGIPESKGPNCQVIKYLIKNIEFNFFYLKLKNRAQIMEKSKQQLKKHPFK